MRPTLTPSSGAAVSDSRPKRHAQCPSSTASDRPSLQRKNVRHICRSSGPANGEMQDRISPSPSVTERWTASATPRRRPSQSGVPSGHRCGMDQNIPTPSPPGQLIDVPHLALMLGVTERFVRRLVAEDRVPFLKIGKFVRFDPREIDSWVEARRRPERA